MSEQGKELLKEISNCIEKLDDQQKRDAAMVLQGMLIGAQAGKKE